MWVAWQRFAERIRTVTNFFIDQFIEAGECDLVFDLCNPVPAVVTLDYLGLPIEEWQRWAVPFHTAIYTPRDLNNLHFAQLMDSFSWIHEQIRQTVADRRRSPRADDFISALVRDDENGIRMDDELAFQTVFVLIAAGVDTTTSLLSATLHYLAHDDKIRRRLTSDPRLLRGACEEFLRYFSPGQATARTTTTDVEVRGVHLGRGDRVLLAWASANRDVSAFDRPDEVVIDRPNNRHVAFAHGIHRCLGAPLARQEFVEVIGEVLRRLPDFQIDPDNSKPYPDVGLHLGFQNLACTFTKGRSERIRL